MGVPLYGQSFTLSDPKNNGLNAKAPGPGQAGEYTRYFFIWLFYLYIFIIFHNHSFHFACSFLVLSLRFCRAAGFLAYYEVNSI